MELDLSRSFSSSSEAGKNGVFLAIIIKFQKNQMGTSPPPSRYKMVSRFEFSLLCSWCKQESIVEKALQVHCTAG